MIDGGKVKGPEVSLCMVGFLGSRQVTLVDLGQFWWHRKPGRELAFGLVIVNKLNCSPPKRYLQVLTPNTCECLTLFGNRIFSDILKLRWGHTWLGWALIQYDWCPYKRRETGTQRDTWEECHVKTEAGTGMTQLQAKGHQGLLAPTRQYEDTGRILL